MIPTIGIAWEEGADSSLALPSYETAGAAGADVRANLPAGDRDGGVALHPGQRALFPTGLRLGIPAGWEVQVRPRSGLAYKHGVTLLNTPGTIDSDYRGGLGVLLINLGAEPYIVQHGERIAQLVVAPALQAKFLSVEGLDDTARGGGGFGSTGRG